MKLTNTQTQKIFNLTKKQVDRVIKINGFYNDTFCNDLEDLVIDNTAKVLTKNDFDTLMFDYNNISNLTQDFVEYLFTTQNYDRDYYNETLLIRKIGV